MSELWTSSDGSTFIDTIQNGSNPSLPARERNRAQAKQKVAESWHSRRLECKGVLGNTGAAGPRLTTAASFSYSTQSESHKPPEVQNPSVCQVLCKAWDQAFADFVKPKKKKRLHRNNSIFPSVISILQANALVKQVEHLQNNTDSQSMETEVLKVLPTGYDWNQAVMQMAQQRSRCFWLVDLSSLVHRLASWKRTFRDVVFLYQVRHNANAKLLQILHRSGAVGLVTTTKADIQACLAAERFLDPRCSRMPCWDNCGVTCKPNGYIRKLVCDAHSRVLAVDGPDDVRRFATLINNFVARKSIIDLPVLQYMIRLPQNLAEWKQLTEDTLQAVSEGSTQSQVVGVSFDLSAASGEENSRIRQLAVEELLDFLSSQETVTAEKLRVDLTGVPLEDGSFAAETVTLWQYLQSMPNVDKVTVDATHLLVSPAASLCTRIIGFRQTETKSNEIRNHYYIDDGCYGSLYQGAEEGSFCPLPLISSRPSVNSNDTSGAADFAEETSVQLSTVWGPTCDGLDKVCTDIPLPLLHRDDWLVFPNIKSVGGLCTAFNGFDPPDTAYCVLNYFQS